MRWGSETMKQGRVGPPEDLELFCRREYPRLVGTLSLYCSDRLLAEELAQETLARACARWEQVSRMAAPGAWAHRVAINAANSYWRRLRAGRRARQRLRSSQPATYDHEQIAADVALREAVAQLPERQRTALVLRYFADLDVDEVAEVMGATNQAVRNLTHRALKRLREMLGEDALIGEQETSDVD